MLGSMREDKRGDHCTLFASDSPLPVFSGDRVSYGIGLLYSPTCVGVEVEPVKAVDFKESPWAAAAAKSKGPLCRTLPGLKSCAW